VHGLSCGWSQLLCAGSVFPGICRSADRQSHGCEFLARDKHAIASFRHGIRFLLGVKRAIEPDGFERSVCELRSQPCHDRRFKRDLYLYLRFASNEFFVHFQSVERNSVRKCNRERHGKDCDRSRVNFRAEYRACRRTVRIWRHVSRSWPLHGACSNPLPASRHIITCAPHSEFLRCNKLRWSGRRRRRSAALEFGERHDAARNLFRRGNGNRERTVSQNHSQIDGGLTVLRAIKFSSEGLS
jgi:hypothetical protein